jgi:2,3-diketo-5-methylthio-1-phosphopentane phosphatase
MRDSRPQPPILFLDFDGTITERDATDALLEAFADSRWLDIESEWQAGRIGSRECLRAQMALMRASADKVNTLLDSIEEDRGFNVLLETCVNLRVPVHIISDGFDHCINRILSRGLFGASRRLDHVRIFSSRLRFNDDRLEVEFPFYSKPCEHGCATCKPAVMRHLNKIGSRAIFVGDGLSDRHAAAHADLVFAKGQLATYCRETSLPYVLYEDLTRVAVFLEALLNAETLDGDAAAVALSA